MEEKKYVCPLDEINYTKGMVAKHAFLGIVCAEILFSSIGKAFYDSTTIVPPRIVLIVALVLGAIVGVLIGESFNRLRNEYIRKIQKIYDVFNQDRIGFEDRAEKQFDLMVRSVDYTLGGPAVRK